MRPYGAGRWRARIEIHSQHHSAIRDTEQAAHDWLEAVKSIYLAERPALLTLGEWGQRWLRHREVSGQTAYAEDEKAYWDLHVGSSWLALRPLKHIEPKHVHRRLEELLQTEAIQRYWAKGELVTVRLGRSLSRRSVTKIHNLLRSAFYAAVVAGEVTSNPAAAVQVPATQERPDTDEWSWLRVEEITRLAGLSFGAPGDTPRARRDRERKTAERQAFYRAAMFTGLRKSELRHLAWARVKLSGPSGIIEVRAPLKSPKARRDIPLMPQAAEALREWRDLQLADDLEGLVWPAGSGGLRHRKFRWWWWDQKQRSGLGRTPGTRTRARLRGIDRPHDPVNVKIHDLRDTFASHLLQGTWGERYSLGEVAQLLGHTSTKVTERYAHLDPDSVQGRMARMALRSRHEADTDV
ncbi:MAG: tyrosine-type recombinase/integrase [Myxococcota bacterium]